MGKIYKFKPPEIEEKYDPLNALPQEILDIIFGYLGVKDLLNLSLSSLNWYNTIENSERIKKTTKLVIQTTSLDSHMIDALLNSTREYQDIRINHPNYTGVSTNLKKDLNTILKKFAGSLKSLETTIDISRVCVMPNLRKLVLDSSNRQLKYYKTGLFKKLELIEELHIRQSGYKWGYRFEKHLDDTLPTMMNLKSLCVLKKNIITDAEYGFHLRKFECHESFNDWLIIVKFLKSQSASLEVLHIPIYRYGNDMDEVLSIILAMPNLNELTLESNQYTANTSRRLPINKTVKSFTILDYGENFAILAFLTSLEVLKVEKFFQSLLNAISTCPSLRQVQYRLLQNDLPVDYMTTVRNLYPTIEFIKRDN